MSDSKITKSLDQIIIESRSRLNNKPIQIVTKNKSNFNRNYNNDNFNRRIRNNNKNYRRFNDFDDSKGNGQQNNRNFDNNRSSYKTNQGGMRNQNRNMNRFNSNYRNNRDNNDFNTNRRGKPLRDRNFERRDRRDNNFARGNGRRNFNTGRNLNANNNANKNGQNNEMRIKNNNNFNNNNRNNGGLKNFAPRDNSYLNRKTERIERAQNNSTQIIQNRNDDTNNRKRRLFVANLDKTITNEELRKIFQINGPLKRCGIHWDEVGSSKGTADVEFFNPTDAENAINELNGAKINNETMYVRFADSQQRRPIKKRLGSRKIYFNNNRNN